MSQSELLTLAVNKAGGLLALSRKTGIPHGQLSLWRSEKHAMRTPTLLRILKSVNLEIKVHEIQSKNPYSDRA